jgi:hypothetical protein
MGSLVEELWRREAAAWAGAERLCVRIEELAEGLARAEEQVKRLVRATYRPRVARYELLGCLAADLWGPAGSGRGFTVCGGV